MRWSLLFALAAGSAGCGAPGVFACQEAVECGGGGAMCQPDGWCSFPDDACESGQRYGDLAGGGLAGACVEPMSVATSTAMGTEGGTGGLGASSGGGGSTLAADGSSTDASGSGGGASDSGTGDSGSGGPVRPDPSLVVWYRFDDPADLYFDSSIHGLHGWSGGDDDGAPGPGILGGAMVLDGVTDHMHVDHVPELELYDDFSVAIWVYLETTAVDFDTAFAKPLGPGTANTWEIVYADGGFYFGGGDAVSQTGVDLAFAGFEQWHHLAFTYSGGQLRAFIDGVHEGTADIGPLEYDGTEMMVGADVDDGQDDNFLAGSLDDARIYDRVLGDAEIAALAAGRRP